MVASWPLVGRKEELDYVGASLSRSSGVVLAGAAGVGKTRLAMEALDQARSRGLATHWAVATRSAASIPFGALAHLLPPAVEADSDQLGLLRRGLEVLAKKANGHRLVLGVDDAHLLDDASAALIHQVAVAGIASVVVTVRTGEEIPDSIVSLWKDGIAERLEVQGLSQKEVEDLAAAALGDRPDRGTLFLLWNTSRGNPLFLREIVLWGLDSGALLRDKGVWRWTGAFSPGPRLLEVIESRLGRLEPEVREVLELIAFGEPISLDLLESLAGAEAIEHAERKGLIEDRQDRRRTQVQLAHPMYSEAVRTSTPTIKARSIMRLLAEAHEAAGVKRLNDALRVALWRLEGGGATDATLLTTAALHAVSAFDYSVAERLARAAVTAGGGFEAQIALADALRSQKGQAGEAEALLSELEGVASTPEERARASSLRAYNMFFTQDRGEEAERVLREAEGAAAGNPAVLDSLTAQRALIALYAGDPLQALSAASKVLDRPGAGERARVEASLAAASAWAIVGQTEKALSTCERVEDAISRLGMQAPVLAGQLMAVRFLTLILAGRLIEAETLAENAYQLAVVQHSHDGMALMAAAAGQAALARGKLSAAVQRLREGAALLRERDRNRFLPWTLGSLARAYALSDRLPEAEAALSEADLICPKSVRLFSAGFTLARAWVAAARSEISRARDLALSAAEAAHAAGQKRFEAEALHDLARLGDPGRVSARLAQLAGETEGDYLALLADHARAAEGADGKALDDISVDFEKIGALLLAAEASAEASRAHRQAGRTASSLASAGRFEELRQRCDGATTPALTLGRQPSPLTPREREIVTLVAEGMSSREIAERLVISVRTVDNHLHHAYSKLGVTKRSQLASALNGKRHD